MTDTPPPPDYDFVVLGAGIVGSAIARELAGYHHTVALVEARDDVGDGTSKANTAILHTGFDAKPGTLESRMVSRGYTLLSEYAQQTGIPVERSGAILVAWNDEELAALPGLRDKAADNGYTHCDIIDADEVYRLVAALGDGALGGLTVPDESIICTWTTNLALATDAVARGVTLRTRTRAESVTVQPERTILHTSSGDISARWVINAAGLGADYIDKEFGYDRFHVTPRRGELLVYDKLARPLIDKIVLPVPTSRGKCSGQPDDLRQRDARAHCGRPHRPFRDGDVGGRLRVLAGQGRHADAPPARGGGHRHVRRTPCRHRLR